MAQQKSAAFFYGTLMHPKILRRVLGHDGAGLTISPAILFHYTRHQVKYADYPGIVSWSDSQSFFQKELTEEERSVRGTLVQGLSAQDLLLLDVFEGSEYTRRKVMIHPLAPLIPLNQYSDSDDDLVPASPPPIPAELPPLVEADTYVFREVKDLQPDLWSFSSFVKENAWKWIGQAAFQRSDIVEVDRVRESLAT